MATMKLLLFLALCSGIRVAFSDDTATLQSLKTVWKKYPPNWDKSPNYCEWKGLNCTLFRVTAMQLPFVGLEGTLNGDIGGLTELKILDLSGNIGLAGPLSGELGKLKNLKMLILFGCSFTGNIPDELGNLGELTFLDLNSNFLTGKIPTSLGNLSKLNRLDLASNNLTGSIPVSTTTTPGLDQLVNAKHFHFNKNQLSGSIPAKLFSSKMALIHVLFDGNQLSGPIPSTIGQLQSLEALRLDRNALNGTVPSNISNLSNVMEVYLANNKLTGPFPDLTGMDSLNYVDLSNNSFDPSEAPQWFSALPELTTLVAESVSLHGTVPEKLFSLQNIQTVNLKNNTFNGTLDLGDSISTQLELVDLKNNDISKVTIGNPYNNSLRLVGNPVCDGNTDLSYCNIPQPTVYSSNYTAYNCETAKCIGEKKPSPLDCQCAKPFEATLYFRAPGFKELSDTAKFESLEESLWTILGIHSVVLEPYFNDDDYLQVQLNFFASTGTYFNESETYFNESEIMRISIFFTHQIYKPPKAFGPYSFSALVYASSAAHGKFVSTGLIIGIAIGCTLLVLGLVAVGLYAIRQNKRAERAVGLSRPFASWAPSGNDSGGAPQLKGARSFSFEELKKCTNGFSDRNEIGSGGYGKVYKGMYGDGLVVAIKRAQQGSMQGSLEFKTEIELLSRVHHKNLVDLVGFCFEQGEQMLVYEYMPNGTLRDSLSGRSGIHLDWKKRLRIMLGSARGLAYLHELANPPIIHRDIKTTNILLDEHLTAKVADFGLSKLVSDTGKGHVSTQVKGTLGYLDPEYYMTQQLTEKSDVYSFGVVMLELITSKQPIEKGKYIVREVRLSMNKDDEVHYGLWDLIDRTIRNSGPLIGFSRFLELAMQCVEESAADRPSMSELVKAVETILQNDGVNSNATSAASSATDFNSSKNAPKHPYSDGLADKEMRDSTGAFEYSGGYAVSTKIEPK